VSYVLTLAASPVFPSPRPSFALPERIGEQHELAVALSLSASDPFQLTLSSPSLAPTKHFFPFFFPNHSFIHLSCTGSDLASHKECGLIAAQFNPSVTTPLRREADPTSPSQQSL